MRRRFFSLILGVILVFSLSGSVLAVSVSKERDATANERIILIAEQKINSIQADISVSNVKIVYDFAENRYAVVECNPKGYFIYHIESGVCVEYNLNAQSPFTNVIGEGRYGGPSYYYEKENNTYTHTVLNTELASTDVTQIVNQCTSLNAQLLTAKDAATANYIQGENNSMPIVANSSGGDVWVPEKDFFTSAKNDFGYISGGYCGYIAASLILRYWNYRDIINLPDYYTTAALTSELVTIGAYFGYGNSTWASDISAVINEYCRRKGLPQEANWAIMDYNLASDIAAGRPVIVFGNISNHDAGNHAIVAYGYNTYESPNNITYHCHFGWNTTPDNDYTDVHVSGVTGSIFGSNTKYEAI